MSHVRSDKTGWLDKLSLYPEHIDLLKAVARHSIFWARDIVNKYYFKGPQYFLLRRLVNFFISYVDKRIAELEDYVERYKAELRERRERERRGVLVFTQ